LYCNFWPWYLWRGFLRWKWAMEAPKTVMVK
jgi:hypothetical protein